MSRFIIYSDGEEFPQERIQALEEAMTDFIDGDVPLSVEFVFVDEEEIRRLNRELRKTDKVTDVLSFPSLEDIKGEALYAEDFPYEIDEEGNLMIGSIAVCVKRAEEQAEEYGHSFERELHYLLVHGIMHCLGYDHMTDEEKAEMREKEEYILNKLGITRA
ncbi:MAG: rRNA maturation RNase YbeY [Clostridia bacterium]|nr:rRNA maturation RNase YbeY [Clostridia bacterium]